MQKAYITALYNIMKADARVVSVLSDSGTDYDEMMAREMPSQVVNVGIAEQNQVSMAAGMAMAGDIPFVYTSGAFLAYRAFESIRNDVCYQNQNVKVVGMGSGTSWCTLGPSHHTTEDVADLRSLPNLTIFSASTPIMAGKCAQLAYSHSGPAYIRLGMSGEAEFYGPDKVISIGGSSVVAQGADVCVFTTGSILEEVMLAREILGKAGVSIQVVDLYSIKPLDVPCIRECSEKFEFFVSVEEHNVMGGIGSAISEIIAEESLPVKLLKLGLPDSFAKGYGTQLEVRVQNGLDGASIASRIGEYLD